MSNKAKLVFEGLDELQDRLRKMGADMEQVAVDALKATNDIVVRGAEAGMSAGNLPAGGKYSTGRTLEALRREAIIEKKNTIITAHVGFDIKKGGLASIFLMYGTPRQPKDQALYDAFFGNEASIIRAQREIYDKAVEKIW